MGYAEGKYDKQDVALSVIMQKVADQTTKLVVKTMSEKEEKLIDLLKDISIKCDYLKVSPEVVCTNCNGYIQLTAYMQPFAILAKEVKNKKDKEKLAMTFEEIINFSQKDFLI